MWENESSGENAEAVEPEVIKPSYEQLEEGYKTLEHQVKMLIEQKDRYLKETFELRKQIAKVDDYLDENWEDVDPEEICEMLGLEVQVRKTLTLTAQITIEMVGPRGFAWDDLDEGDFTIRVDDNGNNETSLDDYSIDSVDVSVED